MRVKTLIVGGGVMGVSIAFELARRAVDLYPEDPEAWYLLGDVTYHLGAPALVAHMAGVSVSAISAEKEMVRIRVTANWR